MKTLDEIFTKHDTDKATVRPGGPAHGYGPHYEKAFNSMRFLPIRLLEIGVGGGESVRSWLDYFPAAKVCGIDISPVTNPWNNPSESPEKRYHFVNGDQSSDVFWKCFNADHPEGWDIVIDDGGHCNDGIIASWISLWPTVHRGGLYCIEDLAVVYSTSSIFVKPGWPNQVDYITGLFGPIHQGISDIDSITISRELAIIKKA